MTVKLQLKTLKKYWKNTKWKNVTELRTNTSQILTDMCVPKKKFAMGLPLQKWYSNILFYQFDKLEVWEKKNLAAPS